MADGKKREPQDEGAYETAVAKAFRTALLHERQVRRERARVPEALELLRKEGALGLLAKPRLFGSLAGHWALLERAHELRYDDPVQMVDLARLALVVAEKLDPARHGGARIVADLCCRAAIELANAFRVADQLDEARGMLAEAAQWLQKGTGHGHLEVRWHDVQASFLADSRHFDAACEALDVVYTTQLQNGDSHLAGRALIKKGLFLNYKGDTAGAIPITRKGLSMIDGERDPTLLSSGVHNLARCYMDLGQFRSARALLGMNRRRYKESLGRVNELKLLWLQAQIDLGLGNRESAKEGFRAVKGGFSEAGLRFKEALVALELALVYADEGRAADARSLGTEAAEVFLSLGIE
ncbi:MAG TPA: hypothetical protein VL025_20145, partial [Thermoanaerobaculia bacterium]|nr:hypothetical protein [Thermoanaerobaculia bacterium]